MAKPARQPQPQLKTKIPALEAADLAQLAPPEPGRNLEDLPPEELQVVEDKINDLQNFVFSNFKTQNIEEELFQQPVTVGPPPSEPPKSLAEDLFGKPIGEPPPAPTKPTEDIYKKRLAEQKAVRPYLRGLQGARQFQSTLELYRGGFAKHMLSDSALSLIFAAIGPVGSLLQTTHHKKIAWQYAWSKNFLNPQAVFFYLNALPSRAAFKFITHPVKKTIGLLAKSQNPLFSAHHYQDIQWDKNKRVWQPMVQTVYGFTPLLSLNKSSEKLADFIDDRLLGVKWLTDKHGRRLKKLDDPWRINRRLTAALRVYDKTKKGSLSRKAAQKNIFQILTLLDNGGGFKGFLKNSLLHPLKKASKHLREAKLLLLLGALIWDVAIGIILNAIRYVAVRIISRVPALARVRAKLNQFFTSRRWLSNLNMGRQTIAAQARAIISLNTLSGGFLGAQLMTPFGTQAMYAGGFLGGVVGWQYQALLNMASHPTLMEFARYPRARAIRALGRLGAPGPMLRTAYWLKQNPWFRIPLKGVFLGQLISPFLEEFAGINPKTTIWTATVANYFWASRKFWLQKLLAKPFGRLAVKFGLSPKLVKSFFESPAKTFFKTIYERTFTWPVKKFLWSRGLNAPLQALNKFLSRPLVQKFLKNMLANPGFFMGFELISLLQAAGIPWLAAIPLGPLAGGLIWNIGAFVLETITGVSKATLSSLGWIGFTIGWLGEIASNVFGFALPGWWSITGLTLAVPFSWALVYGFGQLLSLAGFWSLPGLIGFGITTAMESLLGTSLLAGIPSLAALAVPVAIFLIGGLAIFAGLTVFATTWVPFSSTTATAISDCFALNLEANKTTLALNESVETCATYTILPNPLLLKDPRLQCAARLDPQVWEVKNNWTQQAARVSRQLPGENLLPLTPAAQDPGKPSFWQVLEKNYLYSVDRYPFIGGVGSSDQRDLNFSLSVLGNDADDGTHISGQPLSVLISQFPTLASQLQDFTAYLDILQNHPDPAVAKDWLLSEYQTELAVTQDQQSETQELIKGLKNIGSISDLENLLTQINLLIIPPSEPGFYYQSLLSQAQADRVTCSRQATPISLCEQHYDKLISVYESFPDTFVFVPNQIKKLIDLAGGSDWDKWSNELTLTITYLEEEFNPTLTNIIDNLKLTIQQIKDIDLDDLFALFKEKFYYLPGDTVYKICYTATLINDTVASPTQSFECVANEVFIGSITRPSCQVKDSLIFNNP